MFDRSQMDDLKKTIEHLEAHPAGSVAQFGNREEEKKGDAFPVFIPRVYRYS